MESLILCGGYAKRLEPITEFIPKPLLFVNGKPVLDHIVSKVDALGIDRKVISTNRRFKGQFDYWLESRKNSGLKSIELISEPTIDHSEKFGAVKGISYAINAAKINDDLLIVAGDNYFDFDLSELKERFDRLKKPIIAVYDIKSLEDAKMFGVVSMDEKGRITEFAEKPEEPKSTLVSTGIYMFPKETLEKFSVFLKNASSDSAADAIGNFIAWLISSAEVYGHKFSDGTWEDIGTFTSYRKLFYKYL